ncbi:MAG TPA: VCBS repeat-containing protein [Terriglobales bacterium]|nr:VCBS repeat-containing protein [Terriglobales bacterium]
MYIRTLVSLALLAITLTSLTSAETFSSPVNYDSAGFGPTSVALGDLNHDHHLDIVATNQNSATISVLLGNGDGTFQPAVTYSSGQSPFYVILADFTRDGNLDAAVANRIDSGAATVSIMLGNGAGGFQSPVSYGPFLDAFSLSTAYVNNDLKLDLIVSDTGSGALLLGNGDGTFQTPVPIGATNAVALEPLHLFGDFKTDLVSANNFGNSVDIFRGNGHGSFRQVGSRTVPTPPIALVVGDFNHDGIDDVASADEAVNGEGGNVTVFLGTIWGSLVPVASYSSGPESVSIATGDFNLDGKLDIVTANQFFDGTIGILHNKGNGTFQPAVTFSSGGITPTSVRVGDLNGDGRPDLVVAHPNGDTISVLLNQP